MNLAQLLVRSARNFPDAPALYLGQELKCRYHELARRAAGLAGAFATRLRLSSGDRVALLMGNAPEYLEILYGIWMAGLVAVPINARLHPKETVFILRDSGARVLFASEDLASGLSPLLASLEELRYTFVYTTKEYSQLLDSRSLSPRPADPDEVIWLFYTSGTTGRPKGVMLTQRNLLAMTKSYFTDVDSAKHEDAFIYAAPMSHGAGMYNIPHILVAAKHVVPESGGFEPCELLGLMAHHGCASLFAAPTMVKRLVAHVADVSGDVTGLKSLIYGGGAMYLEDVLKALDGLGNRLVQIYGQGESPMTITALSRADHYNRSHPRYLERLNSVGVAQTPVEIRVADAADRSLGPGEVGEVLVRGDTVMRGYWQNSAATAEAIRDGWLHTGDLGVLDADGYLTLRDRCKDVIISGGANIYPREVEEVLLLHPAVHEVSVIGRPHPEWGEEVVAFVVAQSGLNVTGEELEALCLDNIARFKRPRSYKFVSSLPKNSYGKILKRELRQHFDE
jgi:long-chain acyl-CoA synthetase